MGHINPCDGPEITLTVPKASTAALIRASRASDKDDVCDLSTAKKIINLY